MPLTAFTLVTLLLPVALAGPSLQPDDSAIRYIGRFDVSDPKAPRFSWPMTGMSITFHGSQIAYGKFAFDRHGGRLRVIVDGKTQGFVQQKGASSMTQIKLAENLDAGKAHTLEVFKVTEGDGVMSFGGFALDAGQFGSVPKAATRRLEFIGDSDTAGWCADGSASTGDKETKFEDGYVTWAQQLARSLGAEPMVEAVSGWGVTKSSHPIQDVLNDVYPSSKASWDYSKWTPDAVVILIGPNDELKATTQNSFVKQYKNLLDMVATNYKNAKTPPKVIHVCGGSLNGFDPCDDIQTANTQFNQEQEQSGSGIKGYYTSITKAHWNMINGPHGSGRSQYNGCDGHYNEKGHGVLAADILPQVQKIMGWQAPAESIVV